jgi:hypothetical protein
MHSLPWDSILVPEQKKGVKEKLLKVSQVCNSCKTKTGLPKKLLQKWKMKVLTFTE